MGFDWRDMTRGDVLGLLAVAVFVVIFGWLGISSGYFFNRNRDLNFGPGWACDPGIKGTVCFKQTAPSGPVPAKHG